MFHLFIIIIGFVCLYVSFGSLKNSYFYPDIRWIMLIMKKQCALWEEGAEQFDINLILYGPCIIL